MLLGLAGCAGLAATTDCVDEKTCSRSDDGGVVGPDADVDAGRDGGTEAGPPPGCEATPREASSQVVIDKCGVFVSPAGNDSADGSKAKPFKTIGKAISVTRGVGRIFPPEESEQSMRARHAPLRARAHRNVRCDWVVASRHGVADSHDGRGSLLPRSPRMGRRVVLDPDWASVEAAVRRMDDYCFPIVLLSRRAFDSGEETFEDEDAFNSVGGGARFALFQMAGR